MSGQEKSRKPEQALFTAASSSRLRLVRLLIDGGVHVDSRNSQGQTALLIACSTVQDTSFVQGETREKVVKYLVTAGADVNAHDVTGRTPLMYAVITQAQSSAIFDLINAGADPWLEDSSNKCAFDYALQRQDIAHVRVLVEALKRRKSREKRISRELNVKRKTERSSTSGKEEKDEMTSQTHPEQGAKSKTASLKTRKTYKMDEKRLFRSVSPLRRKTFRKSKDHNTNRSSLPDLTPTDLRHDDTRKTTASPNISTSTPTASTTESKPTTNPPDEPSTPFKSSTVPLESSTSEEIPDNPQLCELCKSVMKESPKNEASNSNTPRSSMEHLDLNFSEYDFSGLLYRRRSTGSLFGLTEQRYASIRKKCELGITLEDLFSTTEINFPGQRPMYVKSPRTNTVVDISTNELIVPDLNRARSLSLPPYDDARYVLRVLGEKVGMHSSSHQHINSPQRLFMTSATSVPLLHSPTSCGSTNDIPVVSPERRVYHGSEEDWDDILIVPASYRSIASPDDVTRSQPDIPSREQVPETENGETHARSSPIPTIVLTDVLNLNQEKS